MRKFAAMLICLMLLAPGALAAGGETMVVDYGAGAVLISESGEILTETGEYAFIYRVTYDDIDPARVLYYATAMSELTYTYDASLEDVEHWPEDEGDLIEGGDMDEVIDEPAENEADFDEDFDGEDDFEHFDDFGEIEFDGGFFDVNCALMDSAGNLLTDYEYTLFTHDVENAVVIAYRPDGFVSALDERGNVLLEGEYAAVVSDTNGGFFATKPDLNLTDEYGAFPPQAALVHIRADGTAEDTGMVTGTYDLGGFFSGLMCIALSDIGGEDEAFFDEYADLRYIYIDTEGQDAFGKTFAGANRFSGNYADVTDEDYNERLIDTTGAFVTEKAYSWFDFGEPGDGMPIVANLEDGGFDLLSPDDLRVIQSYEMQEGESALFAYHSGDRMILAYSDTSMRILDATGEVIYTGAGDAEVYAYYNYSDARPERILLSRGEWPEAACTVMDLSGNEMSEAYQEIAALSWKDGAGRYQVAAYDVVEYEEDGVAYKDSAYETYRYGVIDQDGNTVLEMKYTELTYLTPDRYWVFDEEVFRLVDADGNTVFEAPLVED